MLGLQYKAAVTSVSMPLEQLKKVFFIISIIIIFVLGYTHTQKAANYSFIHVSLSLIMIVPL